MSPQAGQDLADAIDGFVCPTKGGRLQKEEWFYYEAQGPD